MLMIVLHTDLVVNDFRYDALVFFISIKLDKSDIAWFLVQAAIIRSKDIGPNLVFRKDFDAVVNGNMETACVFRHVNAFGFPNCCFHRVDFMDLRCKTLLDVSICVRKRLFASYNHTFLLVGWKNICVVGKG